MGTKMAVAFANIFMTKIERQILRQSDKKPLVWKRYIDDVFSLWDTSTDKIEEFLGKANSFHPTITFNAEIAETEITFLDTKVFKGERFLKESVLDVQTHYKPMETFQFTNFYSCHPPGVTKGFIKGEALRLLRTNYSKETFKQSIKNFESRLKCRGYPTGVIKKTPLKSKLLRERNKSRTEEQGCT